MENKLHFVFIGEKLPGYVNPAIDLAVRFSGLEINLISNAQNRKDIKNKSISFFAIEDFYNSDEFTAASQNIVFPYTFRNGFWHKTLERFFVLDQFAKLEKLNSIFHAELDQLLFGTNLLVDNLQKLPGRGIYVPFHTNSSAVASLIYWNDAECLRSLLDFALNYGEFSNEMALIANWANANPSKAFGLPTLSTCVNGAKSQDSSPFRKIGVNETGGLVDAAQIGQWVMGIDPRNIKLGEIPMNKYADIPIGSMLSREQLESLAFKLDLEDKSLFIQLEDQDEIQIFNLHVHSKIHKWLKKSDDNLRKIFCLANEDFVSEVPSARWIQLRHTVVDDLLPRISSPKKAFSFINEILRRIKNW